MCGEAVDPASPRRRHGADSVPITLSISYRNYEALLAQDRLDLEGACCPR